MNFAEILSSPYITGIFIRALIVGILVSLCASLLGVSLVLKRFSMIGDGLSHVGFGALAVATILNLEDYSIEISIPIVIAVAYLLLKLSETGKVKSDSAIAIVSTGAVAIGSIIFSKAGGANADMCNSLFGSASIVTIDDNDLILSIILSVAVLSIFVIFYNRIFAVTFDETFSKATGVKAEGYKMLIAVLTAVTIVLGMKLMGAMMISAILIFPTLTSMRIFKSFRSVIICSALVSVISFIIGFIFACSMELQTGAAVVTVNIAVFILFVIAGIIFSKIKKPPVTAVLSEKHIDNCDVK